MPTFCSFGLVVDGTVDGKNNKEEKTREVADIRMYHFRWNFLPHGCDNVICCGDGGWVVNVDCEKVSFAPNRVHWVLDDSLFSTLTIDIHFSLGSSD